MTSYLLYPFYPLYYLYEWYYPTTSPMIPFTLVKPEETPVVDFTPPKPFSAESEIRNDLHKELLGYLAEKDQANKFA